MEEVDQQVWASKMYILSARFFVSADSVCPAASCFTHHVLSTRMDKPEQTFPSLSYFLSGILVQPPVNLSDT